MSEESDLRAMDELIQQEWAKEGLVRITWDGIENLQNTKKKRDQALQIAMRVTFEFGFNKMGNNYFNGIIEE